MCKNIFYSNFRDLIKKLLVQDRTKRLGNMKVKYGRRACHSIEAFPGVWGNKGTCSFIFREQGNNGKYLREQGNKTNFGNREHRHFENHF